MLLQVEVRVWVRVRGQWLEVSVNMICSLSLPGEGGQGVAAGRGAAPETRQHETTGGESDIGRSTQEVY